ncbi:MAG: methyl-accepting chemotaxis protein, partial [Desulfobacteraceae bacterium]|nr:methyl-accepting chemotaxis protein [Desulfobacteraceae bacterium]
MKVAIGRSLKQQVLFFTIAPILAAIAIYSAVTVYGIVSLGDERIQDYREELLARKKEALKNYMDLVFKNIEGLKADQVVPAVKRMRYGANGVGYFWINDLGRPYPRMVMHPTIPALDGQIMNDPKFDCALGKKKNLFAAFVDVCLADGEGYVDYLWPKPTKDGLTEAVPKLSYVRLYKPLNVVIGTGLYIDDIDALAAHERERIKKEITSIISRNIAVSLLTVVGLYFFVSFFLDKYMVKPLGVIATTLRSYDNDLTVTIPVTTENEVGEVARSFNGLIANLRGIITNMSGAGRGIDAIAGELTASVGEQAAVSSEQSAAVAEITATMEELSASSMQIAEHSRMVVELATKAWDSTKRGADAAEAVMAKMQEIHDDNQNSINEIVELGRKSREISKVMEIINTIADQTKL